MDKRILVIKPEYDAWPLGFAYVLACLDSHGIPFDFVDASRSPDWRKDANLLLSINHYTAIASGGLIGFESFFKKVKCLVENRQPRIPMILGGNITKDAGAGVLFEYIGMDCGVIGEAETSLPGLIEAIARGETHFRGLPGVIYRDENGVIVRNAPVRLELKQYTIMPAWHHFEVEYYVSKSSFPFTGKNLRFMPVLTGRGCIGRCSFCSPSIGGFRERPVEHILDEIRYISSRYSFDRILIYNEMFYPTRAKIKEFCARYKESGLNKPWYAQVRIDVGMDAEILSLMKDAGCFQISAGIESGSDKVLKQMNKNSTVAQIRDFFRNCRIAKLPANGTFIVGSEGETEEDLKKTIDLLIDEEINTGESMLYVYPGTAVYERAVKRGLITDEMKHLEKGYLYLYQHDVLDKYLNLSAIPDESFLDIVIREIRRYHTFVFNRYPVSNLSCKLELKGDDCVMALRGECHECGAVVSEKYPVFNDKRYNGILGEGVTMFWICPKCFSQLSYNVYSCATMNEMVKHGAYLKERISKANKIVMAGLNSDAMSLLRVNMLGLDYEKLVGFVNIFGWPKGKHFVNYPLLSLRDMVDVNPDFILMLDCTIEAEGKVKELYKHRLMPEIMYLCDADLLRKFRKIASEFRMRALPKGWLRRIRFGLEWRMRLVMERARIQNDR